MHCRGTYILKGLTETEEGLEDFEFDSSLEKEFGK